MKTAKKWKLNQKEQVDRMIDEGLGGGRIVEPQDLKKLRSADEKKKEEDIVVSSMAPSLAEIRKLGKEMEGMENNKDLKKKGQVPDLAQKEEEE